MVSLIPLGLKASVKKDFWGFRDTPNLRIIPHGLFINTKEKMYLYRKRAPGYCP